MTKAGIRIRSDVAAEAAEGERVMSDREKVYDEQIAPLMEQIIAIAKRERIPTFATFQIDPGTDEDPMLCTTRIPDEDELGVFEDLLKLARPPRTFMAFTITKPD